MDHSGRSCGALDAPGRLRWRIFRCIFRRLDREQHDIHVKHVEHHDVRHEHRN
jgi:hypothetical protein